ncbi:hypothetical protein GIB67_022488, partial [Kingdonia uniflora]
TTRQTGGKESQEVSSSSQTSKEVKPKVKRGRKPVKKEEVMADDSNEEKPDEAEDGEVSGEDEPAKLGDGDESDGGDERFWMFVNSKQCKSFERRAIEVRELLSTVAPGVTVKFNPEKPRKGCFEIREEGGNIFLTLEDLKRPFKQMKELDLNVVVAEIVEKIAAGN